MKSSVDTRQLSHPGEAGRPAPGAAFIHQKEYPRQIDRGVFAGGPEQGE